MLRSSVALVVVYAVLKTASQPSGCEPWCSEPCAALNGNVEFECGGCSSKTGTGCYPGAEGYDGWAERAAQYAQHGGKLSSMPPPQHEIIEPGCDTLRCKRVREKRALEKRAAAAAAEKRAATAAAEPAKKKPPPPPPPPKPPSKPPPPKPPPPQPPQQARARARSRRKPEGLGTRHDGRTAAGAEVRCELNRYSRAQLVAMSHRERAKVLEEPAVLTGMIDDWPALQPGAWDSPRNFSARFGHHRFLAKRVRFGWDRAAEEGRDVETSSVSVAELVQRTRSEHIIVLDEYGKGEAEEDLLNDLHTEYRNPDIFEAASLCRVFSFGGGHRGVQMMQHGVAWLGLVAGAKLWHLAPPHLPKPKDRTCDPLPAGGMIDYGLAKKEGVTHCLLLPGETVFVPENWWHATCNLDPYTIGVGGQLWRRGMTGNYETAEERRGAQLDLSPSYGPEALTKAMPLADEVEPIVFDPELGEELGEGEEELTRVKVSATTGA